VSEDWEVWGGWEACKHLLKQLAVLFAFVASFALFCAVLQRFIG
jgi:hypothetical protein